MPRQRTPGKRNLDRRYTIFLRESARTGDNPRRGISARHKAALVNGKPIIVDGEELIADRRRWNPIVAGKLGKQKQITGTARELFVNLGDKKRGLGTINYSRHKKSKKANKP